MFFRKLKPLTVFEVDFRTEKGVMTKFGKIEQITWVNDYPRGMWVFTRINKKIFLIDTWPYSTNLTCDGLGKRDKRVIVTHKPPTIGKTMKGIISKLSNRKAVFERTSIEKTEEHVTQIKKIWNDLYQAETETATYYVVVV